MDRIKLLLLLSILITSNIWAVSYTELEKKLRHIEQNISKLSKNITNFKTSIRNNNAQQKILQKQSNKLKRQLGRERHNIDVDLRTIYQLNNFPNQITQLLSDTSKKSYIYYYYKYIFQEKEKNIKKYNANLEKNTAIKKKITLITIKNKESLEKLSIKRIKLAQDYKNREKIINKIAKNDTPEKKRQRIQEESRQVGEITQKKIKHSKNINLRLYKGKIKPPSSSKILHKFGSVRTHNLKWQGITFAANTGDAVLAIAPGTAIFSGYLKGYGLVIMLDHGDNYISLYAHMDTLLVRSGQRIDLQQKIATAGKSGGQTISKLYFEIRYKGKPINPKPWLKKV